MFKETQIRSVAKALSWRVLATLTTGLLVFVFTGSLEVALTVGALEAVAKLLLYFVHERVWDRLGFGRVSLDQDHTSGEESRRRDPAP